MLMALANKRGALALTTGNKSELGVGYCTTYGDMAGALAPIGDVYKTRVYALARFINSKHQWIPQSSITKPPSAELRPDQTDQDTLPPYSVLDRILEMHFEGLAGSAEIVAAGFERVVVDQILMLVQSSEFKRRQAAPALKVTSKAFGLGRRIPVAKGFEDSKALILQMFSDFLERVHYEVDRLQARPDARSVWPVAGRRLSASSRNRGDRLANKVCDPGKSVAPALLENGREACFFLTIPSDPCLTNSVVLTKPFMAKPIQSNT